MRQSSRHSVPYNPQDWGPMNDGSDRWQRSSFEAQNALRIVPQTISRGCHTDADTSLSPPPPPYSPPSQRHQLRDSVQQISSPATSHSSAVPSPYNVASHVATETTAGYRQGFSRARPRPLSMIQDDSSRRSASVYPPPPPPQGCPGSRSTSHGRYDAHRGATARGLQVQTSSNAMASDETAGRFQYGGYYAMAPTTSWDSPTQPPASRRAMSAGAVVSAVSSARLSNPSRSSSPSRRSWEPGMPLPPPPPGPPPGSRPRSVSRSRDVPLQLGQHPTSRARARKPPVLGTGIGSIPPTPADWVDEPVRSERRSLDNTALHVDTSRAQQVLTDSQALEPKDSAHSANGPASGGLFRSSAIRDASAKGIRERRIERKQRQSRVSGDFSALSSIDDPWDDARNAIRPPDLVLSRGFGTSSSDCHQVPMTKAAPPTGASFGSSDEQTTATTRPRTASTGHFPSESSYSTPRAETSPAVPLDKDAETPPFSADGRYSASTLAKNSAHSSLPKTMPTSPPESAHDLRLPSSLTARSNDDRPVSHILHLINEALPTVLPLSPRRMPPQNQSSLDSAACRDDKFLQDAVRRHQTFIESEANAANEVEALKLFVDYIVSESSIRRERYVKSWEFSGLDLDGIRQRLFQPPAEPPAPVGRSVDPSTSQQHSTPAIALDIPQSRPESAWWNNYQPCLSPIASMSMSNDEMSSRGRPPSRWWESKSSSGGGPEPGTKRSKRESKYMGLPRELREAMQWGSGQMLSSMEEEVHRHTSTSGHYEYGPDEYPPEKVGWHEETQEPPRSERGAVIGIPNQLETQKMDISRLITLPPPYPRHYPAVNNNHPDLVTYRTTVRSITDLVEVKATRQRHESQMEQSRKEHQQKVQDNRRQFKANVQNQIEQGSITFAEAAEAEAAMIADDHRQARELAKRDLDTFQQSVGKPTQQILTDRIERATACIEELSSQLFDDAQHATPDQTQEEGDEKPELLEKLTQLKWLFEAREQLHREMYDLVSVRNEKYRAVVTLPYEQKGQQDKVCETTAFFAKDAMDRRTQHEADAVNRLESFLDVVERNVVRGVEVQLSAFWDIAPSLLALVQKVPDSLDGFQVQIPTHEYEENPSYHEHPLQYLYSLVSHAEKSCYQYIESQTNLLCLLHEVKSAAMRANCKLAEAERIRHGEAEDVVHREMQQTRAEEERLLTADLKDKVATVESQWSEALGSQLEGLRDRVKEQLIAEGGWDQMEQLEDA